MTKNEEYHYKKGHEPIACIKCQVCGVVVHLFNQHEVRRRKHCSVRCQSITRGRKIGAEIRAGTRPHPTRGKRLKPRATKVCEHCKEQFEIVVGNETQEKQRFCSKKCAYDGIIRGRFHGENSPRWTERITIKCPECGNDFQDYAARKKRMRFCSKECTDKSFRRHITIKCQHCGKSREIRAKYADQKYCCRRCYMEAENICNTSIERAIEGVLQGISGVEKQYPWEGFLVDFAIPHLKIFIECDGEYWHSQPATQRRDYVKNKLAAEQGCLMLRFNDTRINNDLAGCASDIRAAIMAREADMAGLKPSPIPCNSEEPLYLEL